MSLSIRQIAEIAGVSRGTVDRALNGRGDVNPGIRQKILKIAAEAGYRANRAGKMLGIRKKPVKIGIQMPSDGNEFFHEVMAGMNKAATELADFGLSLAVKTMKGFSAQTQISQIRQLLAESINALAFVPVVHPDVTTLLHELADSGLPVMTFNSDIPDGPHLGTVGNDDLHSGAIAAGLLGIIAGGRPCGTLVITGSSQILGHSRRVAGFVHTAGDRYQSIRVLDILENQDDETLSYERMKDALDRLDGLDAVFIAAGGAAGACRAIQEHMNGHPGKKTVKVICFDQPSSTLAFRRSGLITASIGQEPEKQGYLPVKYLFDYLVDGTLPPRRTHLGNEIVIREHLNSVGAVDADSLVMQNLDVSRRQIKKGMYENGP